MKLFKLSLFNILILCFLFAACEQEELIIEPTTPPTEEELATRYLAKTRNLVLFAALQIDYETYEVKGYFINKYAELRRVDLKGGAAKKFGIAYLSDDLMRDVHDQSELVETLSVIETAAAVRKASSLSKKDIATEDEEVSVSKLYLAFSRNTEHEASESCGPGNYDNGNTHHQILIDAAGHLNGANSNALSVELLEWLKGLEDIGDRG